MSQEPTQDNRLPKLSSASVTVMRSFDYCHFSVTLSTNEAVCPNCVDDLRKEAARLADKSVVQYQIAKRNAELLYQDGMKADILRDQLERYVKVPDDERTETQKAFIKANQDRNFEARRRNRYDYEDQWDEPRFDDDNEW